MPATEMHEEEINQLKRVLDERRTAGVKGAYPAEVRRRIIHLWRSGVPMKGLSERLGIATSMLYSWEKKEKASASSHEAAHVLQVEPGPGPRAESASELRLQMGQFAITVSLAGA